MVNFGPPTAEICWQVWGTPTHFSGFHILAALLHGTLVVGVSQTLRHWTEGATYIRQVAITLGMAHNLVFPYQAKRLAWGTSPKWPILCRVGHKTIMQSISQNPAIVSSATTYHSISGCFPDVPGLDCLSAPLGFSSSRRELCGLSGTGFYRLDILPIAYSAVSKHLRKLWVKNCWWHKLELVYDTFTVTVIQGEAVLLVRPFCHASGMLFVLFSCQMT